MQEDDGDEDFEPPLVDEEEEGDEGGIRRRNIQARELHDLVQDAYKQVDLRVRRSFTEWCSCRWCGSPRPRAR